MPSQDLLTKSLFYFKKSLQIQRVISFMIDDFIRSRFILCLSFAIGMMFLIVYIVLLRYLTRWIIWLSLISFMIVFALAAVFCFTARQRLNSSVNVNRTLPYLLEVNATMDIDEFKHNRTHSDIDPMNEHVSSWKRFDNAVILLDQFVSMNLVWLILGILSCAIWLVLILFTVCLCSRLQLAAGKHEHRHRTLFTKTFDVCFQISSKNRVER
jgi:ABC-type nickel/cobalt efflux system permease component RcnA